MNLFLTLGLLVMLFCLACSGGLSDEEVRQIVQEHSIPGPKGDVGPQGPKGDRGDVGPQGPKGDPGALPTSTPKAIPTATPTPAPTPRPIATPTPHPEAHVSVILSTSGDPVVRGEERRIDFIVINESREPASDVALTLEVREPSRLVMVGSARGTCEESACSLGSLDDHETVTGHAVVLAEHGFETEVTVDADVSWLLKNSNRRYSYAQITAPFADDQPGALIWWTPTGANSMSCGDSVVVDAEAAYSAFGRNLYAVSRSSGEVLWHKGGESWMFQPILADGGIYFHSSDRDVKGFYIRSLDASNGQLNWEYLVDGQVRGPGVVYGGSVFFTVNHWVIDGRSEYSYLLSLDASTGILNWRYRVDKWINTTAIEYGGNIFFGTYAIEEDYLYAIDPRTGELSQRFRTAGGSYVTPLIVDNNAYMVSGFGALYAIDLTDGSQKWEYQPEDRASGTPTLSNGIVYIRVYDEEEEEYLSVHAIDAETGNLKWLYKPGDWLKQPMVLSGNVYVPSGFKLVSLDGSTGSINWEANYGRICGPLTAIDGVLYGRASRDVQYLMFAVRSE